MKYLLFLLCILPASCVATTGDLANLSAQFAESLQTLDAEVMSAQTTGVDTTTAYALALQEMSDAVEDTILVIEGRVASVSEGVAVLTTKVAEGPSGWLELLAAMSGAVAAGGLGLNHYRNGTRGAALEGVRSPRVDA